jgi:hypothetical protein
MQNHSPMLRALSVVIPLLCTFTSGQQVSGSPARNDSSSALEGIRASLQSTLAPQVSRQLTNNVVLILENPPSPVDPRLDLSDSAGRQTLSFLLNRAPTASYIAAYTSATVPSTYMTVLEHHQAARPTLSFLERWRWAKATRQLFVPPQWWTVALGLPSDRRRTAHYSEYLNYQREYENLVKSAASKETIQQLDAEWRLKGFKSEIENALRDLSETPGAQDESWWHNLRDRYDLSSETLNGEEFPTTFVEPEYPQWISGSGWVRIKVSDSQQPARLSVELDVKMVRIERPWFEPSVFTSHSWRWVPNSGWADKLISDGPRPDGALPDGLMPLLPSVVLLAKNIQVSGAAAQQINGAWFKPAADEAAIIGWFCELVPRSPDPDPSYRW